jgi:uncharacterized protein YciI
MDDAPTDAAGDVTAFALVLIRYRRPLEEVQATTADHRAYLATLQARGVLLASGPFEPRTGGALLLRFREGTSESLETIRDNDPYWQRGLADYELLHWAPTLGRDLLDPA